MKTLFTLQILLLTTLCLLTAAPAWAQVQALTAWWIDTGDTDSTYLGSGMAPLGDINGDGYDDFVAGAIGVGELFVYLGSDQPDTVPGMIIPNPDTTLLYFGTSLYSVGDVNGDEYLDFGVQGFRQDLPPVQEYAYIYLGGPLLDSLPALTLPCESPQQSDLFGFSGAGLGDINGDGYNDFAITDPYFLGTAWGAIYLYYGGPGLDSIPDVIIRADSTLDHIGFYVEPLGDVNGDGYADWVMSHPQCNDPNGEFSTGVVAIYYGGNPPDTIPHQIIYGSVPGTELGMGLTTLDWDGDGQKDIFAWCGNFYPPNYHGAVWEFKVSPTMTGQPTHVFLGNPGYPGIGEHLFHVDLDGNGKQDLVSGAPGYAMSGRVDVFLNAYYSDTLYDAYYFQGNFNQQLGKICANVGDLNGDGIEDLVVSEPAYSSQGRLHLILGSAALHQSGVEPVEPPPLPQSAAVMKASPNPFNGQVVLEITAPSLKDNQIQIYNFKGEVVRRFSLGYGQRRAVWDGKSASGLPCASGVYLAKFSGAGYQVIQKLILMR